MLNPIEMFISVTKDHATVFTIANTCINRVVCLQEYTEMFIFVRRFFYFAKQKEKMAVG
jgi:hypothetical protein